MSNHAEMQDRLKTAIQKAILNEGRIEGSDNIVLTNTDVVDALLEVTGCYASLHDFDGYTSTDLASQYAKMLRHYIDRFRTLREKGILPLKVVPRREVN